MDDRKELTRFAPEFVVTQAVCVGLTALRERGARPDPLSSAPC